MAENEQTSTPDSSRKKQRQLRMTGTLILSVGLAVASSIYWAGTHSTQSSEEDLLPGTARAESRQMEILYGKMGLVTQKISDTLKQPGTQAFLVAAISLVMASGCFYFARWIREDGETDERNDFTESA